MSTSYEFLEDLQILWMVVSSAVTVGMVMNSQPPCFYCHLADPKNCSVACVCEIIYLWVDTEVIDTFLLNVVDVLGLPRGQ